MQLLSLAAGVTLEEADEWRRRIVKGGRDPRVIAALRGTFLELARQNRAETLPLAQRAWTNAARFAAYSFNKAHAASFALLAYYSAFTKAHHPLEFSCALLNHHQGLYPLRAEVAEMQRMGIPLHGPSVNRSEYRSCLEATGGGGTVGIRVGLDKVKGLTIASASLVLRQRSEQEPFRSLRDLLELVRLSGREIAALVLSGACDDLFPLSSTNYPFAHEAALERLRQGTPLSELERLKVPEPVVRQPVDRDRVRQYQALVRVRNELNFLAMHLSAHPMALLRHEAERIGAVSIAEVASAPTGGEVTLACLVSAMRRVPLHRGIMQFLTLEDEAGLCEGALLPATYRHLGEQVTTPGPFLVRGKVRREQGAVHVEISALRPFRERGVLRNEV